MIDPMISPRTRIHSELAAAAHRPCVRPSSVAAPISATSPSPTVRVVQAASLCGGRSACPRHPGKVSRPSRGSHGRARGPHIIVILGRS
eukprot:COSAG01_NODE_18222_length_1091_cov_14.476471_1_plen_88_part_10